MPRPRTRTREDYLAYQRAQYAKHAEKRRARRRQRYAENLEVERERGRKNAERRRRAAGALPAAERQAIQRAQADERNRQRVVERAEKKLARQRDRDERREQRRREQKPIPAKIREAWRLSHYNSILRQKYETYDDLRAAAQRGEFD